MSYISSIDRKRDYINTLAYAEKEGEKRGRAEGEKHGRAEGEKYGRSEAEAKAYAEKLASAREMKKDGLSIEQIVRFTKLSKAEIEKL